MDDKELNIGDYVIKNQTDNPSYYDLGIIEGVKHDWAIVRGIGQFGELSTSATGHYYYELTKITKDEVSQIIKDDAARLIEDNLNDINYPKLRRCIKC